MFTFHYVSILIKKAGNTKPAPMQFTFHYVSILIRISLADYHGTTIVYIPLCLYFNSVHPASWTIRHHVYIPLCLYFNHPYKANHRLCISVYIPLCLYFNNIDKTKK